MRLRVSTTATKGVCRVDNRLAVIICVLRGAVWTLAATSTDQLDAQQQQQGLVVDAPGAQLGMQHTLSGAPGVPLAASGAQMDGAQRSLPADLSRFQTITSGGLGPQLGVRRRLAVVEPSVPRPRPRILPPSPSAPAMPSPWRRSLPPASSPPATPSPPAFSPPATPSPSPPFLDPRTGCPLVPKGFAFLPGLDCDGGDDSCVRPQVLPYYNPSLVATQAAKCLYTPWCKGFNHDAVGSCIKHKNAPLSSYGYHPDPPNCWGFYFRLGMYTQYPWPQLPPSNPTQPSPSPPGMAVHAPQPLSPSSLLPPTFALSAPPAPLPIGVPVTKGSSSDSSNGGVPVAAIGAGVGGAVLLAAVLAAALLLVRRRAQRRRALDSTNDTTHSGSSSSSSCNKLPSRLTPNAAVHLCLGRRDDVISDKVAASRTQQSCRSASDKTAGCPRSSFPSPTACLQTPLQSAQQPPSVTLSLTDEPASSKGSLLRLASARVDGLLYGPWESISSQLHCNSLERGGPITRRCQFNERPSPDAHPSSRAAGSSSGGCVTSSSKDPEALVALMSDSTSRLVDEQLEVFELLGTGSSGSVYRAVWKGLPVAAKMMVLKEDAQGRARRQIFEATMSVGLTHPNIVNTYTYDMKPLAYASRWRIHSARMTSWQLVILQELCSGGTLRKYINEGAPTLDSGSSSSGCSLPTRTRLIWALQLAHDIACGLQHLHAKNIVHLDLTPNNVLLQAAAAPRLAGLNWDAKVADFGLSVAFEDGRSHASRVFVGTPHYIAPETQAHGTVSKQSDIFTFGVLLYELAAGSADVLRAMAPCERLDVSSQPSQIRPRHADELSPPHSGPLSAADGCSAAARDSSLLSTDAGESSVRSSAQSSAEASCLGSHGGTSGMQLAATAGVMQGVMHQAPASAAPAEATDMITVMEGIPGLATVTTGHMDDPPCTGAPLGGSEGRKDAQTADEGDDVLPPLLGGGRLRHDANVLTPLPSTWPAEYRALVRACLSQAPGLRPSVAEVRQVLERLLDAHADVNS